MNPDFAFVDEVVAGIGWDAKYATSDNFVGRPVDGYETNRIVGSLALCRALALARDMAAPHGLGLLLWDGYRPARATRHFRRWSEAPEDGMTRERFYPRIERHELFTRGYVAEGSAHSRGSAVDLTLFVLGDGRLVEMGGGHDLMDPDSRHGASGISAEASANRALLRSIMEDSGFSAIEAEWWHYTLRAEPHPGTCFDFVICDD